STAPGLPRIGTVAPGAGGPYTAAAALGPGMPSGNAPPLLAAAGALARVGGCARPSPTDTPTIDPSSAATATALPYLDPEARAWRMPPDGLSKGAILISPWILGRDLWARQLFPQSGREVTL
ncbi:MAG TPA: hypothetical protein VGI99_08565, partial [Gemmataceae bacterium]